MKTKSSLKEIDVADATTPLGEYASSGVTKPVVVTRRGKPIVAVVSVVGMDRESIAVANSPVFQGIMERSRQRQEREGGLSLEEVEARLGIAKKPAKKVRKARAKRTRA